MSIENPLGAEPVFVVAGIAIHPAIPTGLAITLCLALGALAMRRNLTQRWRIVTAAEAIVALIEGELAQIFDGDPRPYLPLLATLFLFLLAGNLSAAVPGMRAPSEFLETAAALATVVFAAVHFYGLRKRGLVAHLRHYAEPNFLFVPFHVAGEITRTLSLAVRLFGNMMSHGLVLALVASIAGLIVPIPFLALGLLIGAVQAYIFTMLAAVYIAAATATPKEKRA
jgi:F-type H+-transporting ATPase subunit a